MEHKAYLQSPDGWGEDANDVWPWSMTRPDIPRLKAFEAALVKRFALHEVERVEHVVAFLPPFDFSLYLGTTTDERRDALAAIPDLDESIREVAVGIRLHTLYDGFTVESQETVDRDYEGSWFYYLR